MVGSLLAVTPTTSSTTKPIAKKSTTNPAKNAVVKPFKSIAEITKQFPDTPIKSNQFQIDKINKQLAERLVGKDFFGEVAVDSVDKLGKSAEFDLYGRLAGPLGDFGAPDGVIGSSKFSFLILRPTEKDLDLFSKIPTNGPLKLKVKGKIVLAQYGEQRITVELEIITVH